MTTDTIVLLYSAICIVMIVGIYWHSDKEMRKIESLLMEDYEHFNKKIKEHERKIAAYKNKDRRLKTAAHNKGWKIK